MYLNNNFKKEITKQNIMFVGLILFSLFENNIKNSYAFLLQIYLFTNRGSYLMHSLFLFPAFLHFYYKIIVWRYTNDFVEANCFTRLNWNVTNRNVYKIFLYADCKLLETFILFECYFWDLENNFESLYHLKTRRPVFWYISRSVQN